MLVENTRKHRSINGKAGDTWDEKDWIGRDREKILRSKDISKAQMLKQKTEENVKGDS